MTRCCCCAWTVVALTPLPMATHADPPPENRFTVEPYAFKSRGGVITEAEIGTLIVPYDRSDAADSETIALRFVRFRATTDDPGPPLVYLAGGPGGSGIGSARGRRFELFMKLRQLGDVIAWDQRGTGVSEPRVHVEAVVDVPYEGAVSVHKQLKGPQSVRGASLPPSQGTPCRDLSLDRIDGSTPCQLDTFRPMKDDALALDVAEEGAARAKLIVDLETRLREKAQLDAVARLGIGAKALHDGLPEFEAASELALLEDDQQLVVGCIDSIGLCSVR